ncbi:hypothetical protein [Rickettsia endosymbiont of Gonocerus acuteangulatus]|uniref:hypothetical protein n=1 Tax=Rickettsia endosymbiont of Gonocerus acuteangulatus TaxID=3066266 RepID=UPI0031333586
MTDIKSILKGINTEDTSAKNMIMINELRDITTDCLKKLQVIRQDLTSAYIVSQHIIINENDKYEFKSEKEVRAENKQHLDLDKVQKEEEKILKDILETISSQKTVENKEQHNQKSALKTDTSNSTKNIFVKIKNLIKKLISRLYPKEKEVTVSSETSNNHVDLMEQNVKNIKIYNKELDKRVEALKNIDLLQEKISQYKERVVDPKECNKKKDFVTEEIQRKQHRRQNKINTR